MTQKTLRVGSCFSGLGGIDLAFALAGHEIAWQIEIDPVARDVLARHFPDVPRYADITQVDARALAPVAVIIGGSPCFAAGTLVKTRRGPVPIERVQVGDWVWTHQMRWRPVTQVMFRTTWTVALRGSTAIVTRVTADHPLWARPDEGGAAGWVPVAALTRHRVARLVSSSAGILADATGWTWDRVRVDLRDKRWEPVYNLEVADDASYTANDWIAHNCQNLSVAGRREGLAGPESRLFFDFVRIADAQPAAVVCWENVPGALTSNAGEDFAVVLRELTGHWPGVPVDGWGNAGWCWGPKRLAVWRVLDAQAFGVPQRRRRVYVVASPRTGPDPLAVLFEPESLLRGAAARSKTRGRIAATLTAGTARGGGHPPGRRREDDHNLLVVPHSAR